MKMKKRMLIGLLSLSGSLLALNGLQAQTTLTGDHIITGDLNVGTTTDKGNLTVTGETGNTAAPGIKVTGDGGVVFGGTSGTGQIPASGAGTRFMWYPKKAALRAGSVSGTQWDDENIGVSSIGLGANSLAADFAIAVGDAASADGSAIAIGLQSLATESGSIALGRSVEATDFSATSIGNFSEATELGAVAIGSIALAAGDFSVAISSDSLAIGDFSVAIGANNAAQAAYSVVVGAGGAALGDPLLWVETDPLFVVGNSNPDLEEFGENAFTIYKNGKAEFSGPVTMPRQEDILMGEFGNPE